jgi:hypothetical protein
MAEIKAAAEAAEAAAQAAGREEAKAKEAERIAAAGKAEEFRVMWNNFVGACRDSMVWLRAHAVTNFRLESQTWFCIHERF